MTHESKDDVFLEKVILFLVVLVGLLLVFNQYQFFWISQTIWAYISIALILALAVLISLLFIENKPEHKHQVMQEHELKSETKPFTLIEKITYGMTAFIAIVIIFNQMQISQASSLLGFQGATGLTSKIASTKTPLALTGDPTKDAMAIVIPRGTPFYGEALGVSFEDPIKSLEIIAQLDPAYGRNKIQLNAQEEKARYISILTTPTITCEFCCGVKTAVTKDGRPACGCKHVWAMRGLAAYLIKNYPQLSDDEIKLEVVKWKGLFFPKQMIQRYIEETQTGQYTPDIAALLLEIDDEKLKEMKQAVASQNTQSSGDVQSSIQELPSMVGGC
ncbi:MAG: hypothetical protein AABX33_00885 [Nanoarchaeota archaeon]